MTKIDIISGFLGAGKTTFIKKMIDEAFKGEQIVLIENEFGEVVMGRECEKLIVIVFHVAVGNKALVA